MMRFHTLKGRRAIFRSFTSLSVEEFERLADDLRDDWETAQQLRHKQANRRRKEGGGRNLALNTVEDQLLLTLVWLKLYSVYLILEHLFGVDESTVSRTIVNVLPLLRARFTLPEHRGRKKIKTLEELKELLPKDIDLDDILADATEQSILRPKHKRTRKSFHSGKQHDFTMKTQIATTRKGYVVHISHSVGGRKHDYRLFKESMLPHIVPDDCSLYLDGGYQGVQKDYPALSTKVPFKRKQGSGVISRSQKIFNKKQRRVRIRVENTLAQLKKFQALNQTYRHSRGYYGDVFNAVVNVFNFRMIARGLA
jgi:hypothetical protein